MQTITATTSDRSDYFRVVNWCYDTAGIGHLVRAIFREPNHSLRITLPPDDERIVGLLAEVADRKLRTVGLDASPIR